MPLYDYECVNCNHVFEVFHKIGEEPEDIACPKCNTKKPRKTISQFKTDAWSKFLDSMEKRVNPHKFKHNLKEV
ncbi:MAG: FmdB family zinc ribbon protein [Syntrophales bacterium]